MPSIQCFANSVGLPFLCFRFLLLKSFLAYRTVNSVGQPCAERLLGQNKHLPSSGFLRASKLACSSYPVPFACPFSTLHTGWRAGLVAVSLLLALSRCFQLQSWCLQHGPVHPSFWDGVGRCTHRCAACCACGPPSSAPDGAWSPQHHVLGVGSACGW